MKPAQQHFNHQRRHPPGTVAPKVLRDRATLLDRRLRQEAALIEVARGGGMMILMPLFDASVAKNATRCPAPKLSNVGTLNAVVPLT